MGAEAEAAMLKNEASKQVSTFETIMCEALLVMFAFVADELLDLYRIRPSILGVCHESRLAMRQVSTASL